MPPKLRLTTTSPLAAALAGLALSMTTAHAAPVAVTNAGFNDDGTQVATPTGWTLDGTFVGTRTGVGALTPTEGTHTMWLNVGTLYQDTGITIELGKTYTLTVDLGLTAAVGTGHTGTYRLYGSTLGHGSALAGAEGSAVPTVNVWNLNETASFTATATEAGQTLGITLETIGTQTEWDNVRVDASTGDTIAPTLDDTVPANGASHVVVGANLVATFSENVVKGTGDIVIKKYDDETDVATIAVTSGNVTVSDAEVTINPVSDLPDDTQVYVVIPGTAIKDGANNFFDGISDKDDWTFTTDATAPTWTTLSPDGSMEVSPATNLVITFDEDVQEGSGNVVIKDSGDSVFETIPFGVSDARVSISGAEVTIDPTGPLALSTGYYVEIASGAIKDLANNDFAGFMGSSTWSFTTGDGTGPITVANFSFDDDGTITSTTPTGWTSVNTSLGTRGTTGGLSPTDGSHQLWLNGGNTIYQDTGVPIELGKTYTLTVDVGVTAPFDGWTGTFRLYGTTLGFGTALDGAEKSVVTTQSVWNLNETVSFTATATEAGQTLGIALSTTGTQTEWDNVRVEASNGGGGGTPFADWAAGYTPPMTAGVDDGFDDDHDNDGTSNGHEFYFFDSDPTEIDAHGSPMTDPARTAADKFEFTHNRPLDRDDVTETYQWSADLDTWYDADGLATDGTNTVSVADKTVGAGPTANLETVTVEATIGGATMSELFMRLNLSSP